MNNEQLGNDTGSSCRQGEVAVSRRHPVMGHRHSTVECHDMVLVLLTSSVEEFCIELIIDSICPFAFGLSCCCCFIVVRDVKMH